MSEDKITFYTVCQITDIPDGERLFLDISGIPVVIFNINGQFYAIKDECTHDNGPLGEGDLDGFSLSCPRHGACFDVRNGKVTCPPAVEDTRIFPVKVEGQEIQLGLMGS